MAITPDTTIKLLKVPLTMDNKNQFNFSNVLTQFNYFNSIIGSKVENNCTYQRKDNIIRFPAHIDDIINYNYVMYKNTNYGNKWFYAFITKMEYVNDNLTLISIETDCWQTWQFDIIFKKCFIEREHVNDDTIGKHTIPEGLETGEYIIDNFDYDDSLDELLYVIQTMKTTTGNDLLATNYGGIYLAGGAYITDNITTFINIIQALSQYDNAIFGAYVIPKAIVNNTSQDTSYSGQNSPETISLTYNKPSTLNGYTPVNKKLLTYPYCFINMSNNNGSTNSMRYEDFYDPQNENQIYFQIKGIPVPRWFN